ncbi:hypothetical protein BDEG_22631 [Batrachochytrium dendrobatidis JEL423]|uniref:DUF4201 domain-containing protein n=1 Tax=Batrachochytrium dendrobatidis (strain JEL423) TaxID=403673 RepID=A0A177WG75_BATDL|nr:hypothetical protein BDEG_22631 [Batrachochytrium dendrobatidis JEL423]
MNNPTPAVAHAQTELKHLPISEELLSYYRRRLENSEDEYQKATQRIEQLSISHEESHKLSWELHKRAQEVVEMQQALSDFQTAFKYCKLFRMQPSAMKADLASPFSFDTTMVTVQELKDRKKIRFLLSLSGAPQEEVTYFRDRLDQRLVKIARVPLEPKTAVSNKAERKKIEEQDLIILEDEVQGLRLTVLSLQTQLDEQKKGFDETISGLMKDRKNMIEEERVRREYDAAKIEEHLATIKKLRILCRENTRELLRTKKVSHAHERSLIEEKAAMVKELGELKSQISLEQDRNENAEKVIESRVSRKQEGIVADLRHHLGKLEAELLATKAQRDKMEASHTRQVGYTSLKRRRDYEIEGFTNDILSLRKQLRTLEKNILKYGPLEDKELVLLNLARLTGERANKISTQLQSLKAKVYATEKEVQDLDF